VAANNTPSAKVPSPRSGRSTTPAIAMSAPMASAPAAIHPSQSSRNAIDPTRCTGRVSGGLADQLVANDVDLFLRRDHDSTVERSDHRTVSVADEVAHQRRPFGDAGDLLDELTELGGGLAEQRSVGACDDGGDLPSDVLVAEDRVGHAESFDGEKATRCSHHMPTESATRTAAAINIRPPSDLRILRV
jgi:hypothetical protein